MTMNRHMRRAIELALKKMREGAGGPFGAVVVRDGEVIAEGLNCVTSTNDPTAHAEVVAIRNACSALGRSTCRTEIYTSCEPCLMCMGAIYWSRMRRVFYSSTRADVAKAGFDDEHIYTEITLRPEKKKIPAVRLVDERSELAFDEWVRDSVVRLATYFAKCPS